MFESCSSEAEPARRSFFLSDSLSGEIRGSGLARVSFTPEGSRWCRRCGSCREIPSGGESLRELPCNTSALKETCFVARRALFLNVQGIFDIWCYLSSLHLSPPLRLTVSRTVFNTTRRRKHVCPAHRMFVFLFVGFLAKMAAFVIVHVFADL